MNLIDLVDGFGNPNQRIKKFKSVEALSDYTIDREKYFPRGNVHAGDLLKYLLRHINCPALDSKRRRPGGRRRRGAR